jgi:2-keto-4-pentenoate hydratase/2-oxohepta-3-ene-1,7-dioic acid hydratase in catechol pathway
MQDTLVSDLLFGVEDLIVYLSTILPLQPGDVVATGTTGGVGAFRDPKVWMKAGDVIEVEISGLGTLKNRVVDE